jgi:hypothetical protein
MIRVESQYGTLDYIEDSDVSDVKSSQVPQRSSAGYGTRKPSQWMLKINSRWHRVYICQFSNAGTSYILIKGNWVLLGSFDPRLWLYRHASYIAYGPTMT